jgi:hypothetical protein
MTVKEVMELLKTFNEDDIFIVDGNNMESWFTPTDYDISTQKPKHN